MPRPPAVRPRSFPFRWLAVAGVAGTLAACANEEPRRLPNVLLVVFDTTRFDDWSAFGPTPGVTPTLDSLAATGQAFTRANSLYTSTVPSHVALFTGNAIPLQTRVATYDEASLFTILGEHGYRTYAFSGNPAVWKRNLDALDAVHVTSETIQDRMPDERVRRILEAYGEWVADPDTLPDEWRPYHRRKVRFVRLSAEFVNEAVVEALSEHRIRFPEIPVFLFVNYIDAHAPYWPEPPFDRRFRSPGASDFNGNLNSARHRRVELELTPRELARTSEGLSEADLLRAHDLHLGELAFADRHFGRLLRRLREIGFLDSAVIVCTSDHGELFGEHGRLSHAGERVPELLHVPLVMRFPDAGLPPARHATPVDLRDVKPTLLELLGVEDRSEGRSLWPVLRGETRTLADPAPVPDPTVPDGLNLVPGQDPETQERLMEQIRALGYIE